MIPCIVLVGPIGLCFGYMSAEGNNILPSVSLVFSSMLIIASCFTYAFARQLNAFQTSDMLFGMWNSYILWSFARCFSTVIVLWRRDYCMIPLSWMSILKDKDVHAFFSLLLPATINLAFVHIASFTDLCFSSLILGATAGLSWNLLRIAIFNISYIRGLFPEKYFNDKSVPALGELVIIRFTSSFL
ncbi:uncharacterized protein LOC114260431 isoform X3 [Camellia sinensis]|uniref:uncharacterized protein LOC114260431 isoform X3 n=2 Tax=Camellia sinensis TaxID=4442 RepID=UPI0010366E34|nr:uncharacterized protein LOC114260431 isoform X3 [Camellia sinensis]